MTSFMVFNTYIFIDLELPQRETPNSSLFIQGVLVQSGTISYNLLHSVKIWNASDTNVWYNLFQSGRQSGAIWVNLVQSGTCWYNSGTIWCNLAHSGTL